MFEDVVVKDPEDLYNYLYDTLDVALISGAKNQNVIDRSLTSEDVLTLISVSRGTRQACEQLP